MCDHEIRVIESFPTCILCGQQGTQLLDTTVLQYNAPHYCTKRVTRVQRFARLCKNLQGLQSVPCDVLESCKDIDNIKTLRKFMKKHHHKHLKKLPSVWRQTGHNFRGPTVEEIDRLCFLFNSQETNKSFLVLLPKLLIQIGRPDLLSFVKIPSLTVQKKYNCLINDIEEPVAPAHREVASGP